jgi:hypothetical protein
MVSTVHVAARLTELLVSCLTSACGVDRCLFGLEWFFKAPNSSSLVRSVATCYRCTGADNCVSMVLSMQHQGQVGGGSTCNCIKNININY